MSELKEIWKDVKGYEGYYKISSFANVKSMNYRKTGKEKLLKQSKFTNGYLRVVLSKNGKVKNCLVHRCKDCGAMSRSRTNNIAKEDRKFLLTSIPK